MSVETDCRLLFVYGMLRRGSGHAMADFLAERSRFVGQARVRGRLYDLGRFPGMLAAEADDEFSAFAQAALDEFHAMDAADEAKKSLDKMQKETDEGVKKVDEIVAAKEKEVMQV